MSNNWTTEQISALFDIPNQFLLQDSNQDMIAINQYISDTVAITPDAVKVKDAWIHWWDGLTWYEKNIATATFDEARNRRNAFFMANAPTAAAKAQVQDVLEHGITTEEMEGGTRRADSTGMLPTPPPPPLIPSWFKIGTGIAAIAGVGIGIATIVSRFNPLSLAASVVKRK